MRVFVAGGTGTLGAPTLRLLVQAGHEVRALARDTARRIPTGLARITLGPGAPALLRSQRVANRMLKSGTGWSPRYRSARDGWAAVARELT